MTLADVPAVIPRRRWALHARSDPITGLVAFPDFHAALPVHLAESLACGTAVGIAIGDVDNLKGYVERANVTEPESFGHLAGNSFMARVGAITVAWFDEQSFHAGCASTFGGDEVIIAAALECPATFLPAIVSLSERCRDELPRSVSFALTVVIPTTPGLSERIGNPTAAANWVLASVDRMLFRRKAARLGHEAFIVEIDLDLRTGDHGVA